MKNVMTKLTPLEKDVLMAITKYYAVSVNDTYRVYTILKSFDLTVKCLEFAGSYGEECKEAAYKMDGVLKNMS